MKTEAPPIDTPTWTVEAREGALRELLRYILDQPLKNQVLRLPETHFERVERWTAPREHVFASTLVHGGIRGAAGATGLDFDTVIAAAVRLAAGARLPSSDEGGTRRRAAPSKQE